LNTEIPPEQNDTDLSQHPGRRERERGGWGSLDPPPPKASKITSSGGSRNSSLYSSLLLASSWLCTTESNHGTSETKLERVGSRIRTQAPPTAASEAESWSQSAEAGEEAADASTASGADARRRGGEAGEGAVVSAVGLPRFGDATAVGLARLGEATAGEGAVVSALELPRLGEATAGDAMLPGRGSRAAAAAPEVELARLGGATAVDAMMPDRGSRAAVAAPEVRRIERERTVGGVRATREREKGGFVE
jgi:hypothetical protein